MKLLKGKINKKVLNKIGKDLIMMINQKDPCLAKNNRLTTLLNLIRSYATDYLYNLFEKILLY